MSRRGQFIAAGCAWLLISAAGCAAGPRYFEPAERVQGQTVEGFRVALYPLLGANGAFGEAKLWSSGARMTGERTRVHVGFEIHNTSVGPLTIGGNDVRLDVRPAGGAAQTGLSPLEAPVHTIEPGKLADVEFEFELPPGYAPSDIMALRLHWRVLGVDKNYTQRTPFVRESVSDPAYLVGVGVGAGPYMCWPYGPYDCTYGYGIGVRLYEPVFVPRYVVPERRVTRSRPAR